MHLAQRRFPIRKREPRQHCLWQALRHRPMHPFQQVKNHLSLPARCQPCPAQRLVDRRNAPHLKQARLGIVACVRQQLKLRLNHLQIAARPRRLDPPVDCHRLPCVKLPLQIAPVEPDALHRQPPLPNGQLEDGRFARSQQQGAAHLGNHARHLVGLQFIQAARVLPILIAEGQVVEQVLGGEDALGGEQQSHCWANAARVFHFIVEPSHTLDATTVRRSGANGRIRRKRPWALTGRRGMSRTSLLKVR